MRGRLLVGQDVGGVRCAELARVYVCVNGVAGSSTPAGNGCQSVVLRMSFLLPLPLSGQSKLIGILFSVLRGQNNCINTQIFKDGCCKNQALKYTLTEKKLEKKFKVGCVKMLKLNGV